MKGNRRTRSGATEGSGRTCASVLTDMLEITATRLRGPLLARECQFNRAALKVPVVFCRVHNAKPLFLAFAMPRSFLQRHSLGTSATPEFPSRSCRDLVLVIADPEHTGIARACRQRKEHQEADNAQRHICPREIVVKCECSCSSNVIWPAPARDSTGTRSPGKLLRMGKVLAL